MKTALTEYLEALADAEIIKNTELPIIKKFLEKEKQQITDAWVFGKSVGYSHSENTSQQYYSETFNNKD